MGSRQLFVRFFGCNLSCVFCDTILESYKSLTREGLFSRVLDFGDDYSELALTGGEPLLYREFLEGFISLYKAHRPKPVYLETNGSLPDEMEQLVDKVDVVAMDFKLPSSTGNRALWDEHRRFAEIASRKELITKAVITDSTTMDDVKRMGSIIGRLKGKVTVVLQPVTPVDGRVREPDEEMTGYFRDYIKKETARDVIVLGQVHKDLGIK